MRPRSATLALIPSGLRSRSVSVRVGSEKVRVASLEDILKSKRAAGRRKDLAVLPILEDTLREKKKRKS
jgi:hypothetical protein